MCLSLSLHGSMTLVKCISFQYIHVYNTFPSCHLCIVPHFFPPLPLVSSDGQLFHFLHYLLFTFSTRNHFGLMQTWLFHTFLALTYTHTPKFTLKEYENSTCVFLWCFFKSRHKCHICSYFLRMDCFSLRLWPWKGLPTTRSKLKRKAHESHLLHKIAGEVSRPNW